MLRRTGRPPSMAKLSADIPRFSVDGCRLSVLRSVMAFHQTLQFLHRQPLGIIVAAVAKSLRTALAAVAVGPAVAVGRLGSNDEVIVILHRVARVVLRHHGLME